MSAMWCFQCGLDYSESVAECIECGVPTVDYPASSVTIPAEDDELLAYELHEWNGLARVTVERTLYGSVIPHSWVGPTLQIRLVDEDRVDGIIAAIDEHMRTEMSARLSDGDTGRVGFDVGVRNLELRRRVVEKLDELGIDYEMQDDGFLMVPASHEDQVGDLIEDVQTFLGSWGGASGGLDGVEAHEVVEALFLAADVLRRHPRDVRSQRHLLDNESLARRLELPFGYDVNVWRSLLDQSAVLVALIEDAGEDDLIEREASALRSILHPYV